VLPDEEVSAWSEHSLDLGKHLSEVSEVVHRHNASYKLHRIIRQADQAFVCVDLYIGQARLRPFRLALLGNSRRHVVTGGVDISAEGFGYPELDC
jgi:hypothetical protein